MNWRTIRAVIQADIDARKLNPNQIAETSGMSPTTLYSLLNPARNHIRVDTLAELLAAIGRTFAWVEKQVAKQGPNSRPATAKKRAG